MLPKAIYNLPDIFQKFTQLAAQSAIVIYLLEHPESFCSLTHGGT
jgi:hypothetical protein